MLIYSQNGAIVDDLDGNYRNPDYFERASPTDKVVLVGDYPHIKQAYDAIGVTVEQYEPKSDADDGQKSESNTDDGQEPDSEPESNTDEKAEPKPKTRKAKTE